MVKNHRNISSVDGPSRPMFGAYILVFTIFPYLTTEKCSSIINSFLAATLSLLYCMR